MPLFGKKNKPAMPPAPPKAEPLPTISQADLADASRLMDQWDASLGNSDAVYSIAEQIAYKGGWKGEEATMAEGFKTPSDALNILQRPWRWWNEAARAANASGEHVLAGRIFLLAHLYTQQMGAKMNWQDRTSIGLELPQEPLYKGIAASAVHSLAKLDPALMIHNTSTGQVDVASALNMAEQVSGVTAPRGQVAPSSPAATPIQPDDSSPFNTL